MRRYSALQPPQVLCVQCINIGNVVIWILFYVTKCPKWMKFKGNIVLQFEVGWTHVCVPLQSAFNTQ